MILTYPFPEEIICSHIGRIRSLNNLPSNKRTYTHLRKILNDRGLSKLGVATQVSQKYYRAYCQDHSLSRFQGAFGRVITSYPYNLEPCPFRLLDRRGVLKIKNKASFCKECAREQTQAHGFSYWLRFHQVPGASYCYVHNNPLHHTMIGNAFEFPPHTLIHESSLCSPHELMNNQHIQSYQKIARRTFSQSKPNFSQVTFIEKKISQKLLSREYKQNPFKNSLELIYDVFPNQWIKENFGNFKCFQHLESDSYFGAIPYEREFTSMMILLFVSFLSGTDR